MHAFRCKALSIPRNKNLRWVPIDELDEYPMGRIDRQIARRLRNGRLFFACHQMIEMQLRRRGLQDARVLSAFEQVPRHLFVPQHLRYAAYDDMPLPIGHDQTISQPYIVGLMIGLLDLQGDERVLELGTGSGYQAALLSKLAAEVYTVELVPELGAEAARLLAELGFENVHVHIGDGSLGWPEACALSRHHPVLAAAPKVPPPLLEQTLGGRAGAAGR